MESEFLAFSAERIAPFADAWDQAGAVPRDLIHDLAERGYLGSFLPQAVGGLGQSMLGFGVLNEAIGRNCSSARSLLTVHGMVCRAIARWGGSGNRETWLPRLARGQVLAAFALTEPECGSDAGSIGTRADRRGDVYVVSGIKKWITFGQVADLFLVFADSDKGAVALLVERDSPGLEVRPMSGLLGMRGAQLAELRFADCRVPVRNLVGGPGFGITAVAVSALELGRYSVAWGCAGILRGCREASLSYATRRHQFGQLLAEHQLVRRMLTDMVVDCQAARALCIEAGRALDEADPGASGAVLAAKYFASQAATRAALNAVQVHGANGCSAEYPVARFLRDAKIMEIIEGSNEMQQLMISRDACQRPEMMG